jgi:pyruvate-formate lyase-activating enzyme
VAENAPWKFMEQVMPHLDAVLDDHQVTDPELDRKWVGANNRRVLANFQQSYETFSKQTFIARTPFIPEMNDDGEHIRAVVAFTPPYQKVVDHGLLAYCSFGEYNCEFLGRIYELEDSQRPSAETMRWLRAIIDEAFGRSHQPAPLANPSPIRNAGL